MTARRNAACPCGSAKKYKRCCGRQGDAAGSPLPRPLQRVDTERLIALAGAGRYTDMEAAARGLVAAHSNFGFAWKALSVSLEMQGKDALYASERAAELLPDDPEAHNNLGTAQRRIGWVPEAVTSFHRALAINPNLAQVHNNLGNALRDLGELEAAQACLRRALDLKPDFAKAHNNLGNVLQDQGRLDDAVASYQRALALEPEFSDALVNLGMILRVQGRAAAAEAIGRRALEINSGNAAALTLLADLQADRGEFAAAEASFARALELDPQSADAWTGIAGLRRMSKNDSNWLIQARRLADSATPRREIPLRYALGKYFDDLGDYEQAMTHYWRANELKKKHRPAHDRDRVSAGADRIIRDYDAAWLQRLSPVGNSAVRPVFIVGMPRSGTSLAEQILAAHGAVFGAGELPYWNAVASTVGAFRYGDQLEAIALRSAADDYLNQLEELSPTALRTVDKMPANFLYLGLIHAALPGARIIHMQRDPIDTCLSIYFQNFGTVHSYANDFEDLAHYYSQYRRIMMHWRCSLPPSVTLEVPYEGLIDDQEAWSRRMIEFIGLPWDAKCIDYHLNQRTVSTFSKWQARQPINRSSLGRWMHYEKFVQPLLRLVQEDGDA